MDECEDEIRMTEILWECQGMRRKDSVLDYSVQNRKGQVGQGTGSLVPDLGVGLSATLIGSSTRASCCHLLAWSFILLSIQ